MRKANLHFIVPHLQQINQNFLSLSYFYLRFFFLLINNTMPQNRPFTPEQDRLILYLYHDLKIKQWALVAKKMSEEYKMQRNAKQCRDRYRQFLDPEAMPDWTESEEKQLYRLHKLVGNKWALIATYFPGKTDNYVKNHFYSKIRKALRHLNRVIKTYFKKDFKQIKIATIYKVIEGFQEQFKQKPIVTHDISNQCSMIKDALLNIADQSDELDEKMGEINLQKERILVQKINDFNKFYRKKTKKEKRESLLVGELFKPARKIEIMVPSDDYEDNDSSFQKVNSVASSQSDEEDHEDQMSDKMQRQNLMKEEKDQLRRSPVYVIVKQDQKLRETPYSVKSGIQIRLSDLMSSQDLSKIAWNGIVNSGNGASNDNLQNSFGFMRGQSCFRSYSGTDKSKNDPFEQIRGVSGKLNQIYNEMEAQGEAQNPNDLFRSLK